MNKFGLVLATYDALGWAAVGYYNGARFVGHTLQPAAAAFEQMSVDVFELAQQKEVAPLYRDKTLAEIEQLLRSELVHFCWYVPKESVFVFDNTVRIPSNIWNSGAQRFSISYNISETQYQKITNLASVTSDRNGGFDRPEGGRTLRLHESVERDPTLVAMFKAKLTSFECIVCAFDFEREYGQIGEAFIECHHTRPVSEMRPGERTDLADLAAVCSNCHRMLHRRSPMITVEQLRNMRGNG
jgi:hypothetical protein